ncbi:class I SAM-dependent methyltransferase [Photobacterium atrarenae]|uniref:Methyltransferase domain-containing protein n=1 Tax=Photobacterium atrarenae TaxID=865757 RepID=A0ABY5GNF8_9GAMM|nr:methyltransferase domain-containing protein [Photobacterium atrarenae]UTV30340.1 methyltransferase domain-containing protein [Photobacterium atrarenae]
MTKINHDEPPKSHQHSHACPEREQVLVWDETKARSYAEAYGNWPTNRLAVAAIPFKADDRLLDIGCGSGTALREASRLITSGALLGIDPSAAMLEIAKAQTKTHPAGTRVQYLTGAAEALPLDDGSISVALAINTFHHWLDPAQGLAEVLRVLEPGGYLYIAEDHEVMAWHQNDANHLLKQIEDAGFFRLKRQTLAEGEIAFELLRAQKP